MPELTVNRNSLPAKFLRILALLLAVSFVAVLAAAWYDEGPDEVLERQWEGRPRVEDRDNLFLAMMGADRSSRDPLHVTGRRLLDNPADESLARLQVSEGNRDFVGGVRTECRAIPAGASVPCLFRRLPVAQIRDAEVRMAGQYLALRRYKAYRSEISIEGQGPTPASGILNLQAAHVSTRLAVEKAEDLAVQELVSDTLFLREALSAADSLLAHVIAAVAVERNYRLIAEGIEAGSATQASALGAVLQPVPEKALDLNRDLAYQYASDRNQYAFYRRALSRDEDPLLESAKMTDLPSPFTDPGWQRRFKSLWLKPGMTANAILAVSRESLGIPNSRKPPGGIETLLNATALEANGSSSLGGGWHDYVRRMSDLDHFVRLVALVGSVSGRKEFDPSQVVSDWNSKLSPQAQPYGLTWDELRSGFSFDPQSLGWRDRAKTAGHGVVVHVPPYLVQEVDAWRGIAARCQAGRCELLSKGRAPTTARPKARLPDELGPNLFVQDVKPGKYVGISVLEQSRQGDWVERHVRVRAPNAPNAGGSGHAK